MGLTGLLNVAKNGLVTHQTSLQTIGHNISNVNTRGFSRQDTITRARIPTPMSAGSIGNGVVATEIVRDYDQFITKTLFEKTSDMSGLDTRQSGMKLVEGVLNEVEENGLNQMVNEFWTAWDDVANSAEAMPERTTLLQRADLLVKEISGKYDQLVKLSNDVDLNIDTSVKAINRLADQIAEINVQIVSSESGHHTANDLRDQRDMLVKQMSELADIHYFETDRGSYTVLIGQGKPLVEGSDSWQLEMRTGSIYWTGNAGQEYQLTTKDIQGGELGGWMDLKNRVTPRDTTLLTGSVPNSTGGTAIRSSTRWDAIDGVTVTGNFSITFSGSDQSGSPIGPVTFNYTAPPGESNATVGDFLSAIEAAFPNTEASITDDGRIQIKDLDPGDVPISFQIEGISGGITGLDLGKFDGSYPLNYTEQLNKWASELIKAVNGVHSQGVGLIPLQETTAENRVIDTTEAVSNRSSGLAFSDVVQTGSFEIYLYDSNGDVIDADGGTVINDPYTIDITKGVTTLEDIRDDINANIPDLNARIVNNKLVIGVDGPPATAAGFAFGKDTSGVLTALGINSFFTGEDAATIGLNNKLVEDPRLIAAAQVEAYGTASAVSDVSVMDENRPLDARIIDGTVHIELFDNSGNSVTSKDITIDRNSDSLEDILDQMDSIEGIHAYVEDDLVHIEAEDNGYTVSIDDSAGGVDTGFLEFLDMPGGPAESLDANFRVERTFDVLSSYDTGITTGNSFSIDILDEDGNILNPPAPSMVINVNAGDSLSDIATAIDSFDNISAQIVDGRLKVTVEGDGERFYVRTDNSGLLSYIGLSTPEGGTLNPANNFNAIELRDLNSHTVQELDGATLNEFYQGLVGTVGIHSRGFQLDYDFSRASVDELETRRDSVSGVSLDEEMSDLIKFQHAYTAAAKLIQAADEMFVSLLQAK